jgi:phospholipid/cholesterol/gamma-HCH transport system substrate-binding protein
MESRAYALITGLFVLGVAACIAVWVQWLSPSPVSRTAYRIVATVPVAGLNPEAYVRYRGMSAGRVTSIALDRKDPRRILVDVEVDSSIPITKGTYAQLGMEGITGNAYVHLLDDYKDMALAGKAASGFVEMPLKPAFFDILADGAEGAVKDARELMANLNDLLQPENRRRISAVLASLERMSADLEVTAKRLPSTLARVDSLLSEENRRLVTGTLQGLNATAKDLPALTREAQLLVKDARDMSGKVSRLSDEASSTAIAVREETLPRINSVAEALERDSQRFGRLSLQLDREPQSVIFGRKPGRPGPGEPGFQ